MRSPQEVLRQSPFEIYTSLEDRFAGEPWLTFHSSTMAIQYPNLSGTPVAMDKVLAVHAIAGDINQVCTEHVIFEKACNLFNNNPVIAGVSQPVFLEEVFYTVSQIRKIAETVYGEDLIDLNTEIFMGEIPGYVAAVAKKDGAYILPPQLQFAQGLLNHLTGRQLSEQEANLIVEMSDMDLDSPVDREFLDSLQVDVNENDRVISKLMACYAYKPAAQLQAA